jgi:hypothetical protein
MRMKTSKRRRQVHHRQRMEHLLHLTQLMRLWREIWLAAGFDGPPHWWPELLERLQDVIAWLDQLL